MKLKKSLLALAAVAAMSISAVGAASVGTVNIAAVYNSYPDIQSLRQKVQIIEQKYQPQFAQVEQKIRATEGDEAKKDLINKEYAPLQKKANDEVIKIMGPVENDIEAKLGQIRVDKKLDIIVLYPPEPNNIILDPQTVQVVDLTNELIAAIKK